MSGCVHVVSCIACKFHKSYMLRFMAF
jgi:hypothetical protein